MLNIAHEKLYADARPSFFLYGLIGAVVLLSAPFLLAAIDCDSAYYICMAERIAEGYVPYVDLRLGYTPLWMYIAAGMKILFAIPDGCYTPYLLLHYVFLIGVAVWIYAIARRLQASSPCAFVAAWWFVLAGMTVGGNCVLLEMPSLFWGLASVYFLLRLAHRSVWHSLWIGSVAALAYLTKQYGLGFLVLDGFVLLFLCHRSWRECVLFLLGYVIPIAICYAYWGDAFWVSTLSNGYGTGMAADAGFDVSLVHKLGQIALCLLVVSVVLCPILIVGVVELKRSWHTDRFWYLIFCFAGFLGFSLQFYFSHFEHYALYMLPFAAIAAALLLSQFEGRLSIWYTWLMRYMLLFAICYQVGYNGVYKLCVVGDTRMKQYSFTECVEPYIQPDSKVWVSHYTYFYLYHTLDVLPPNISTIAYSFGDMGLNEQEAFLQATDADWVLRVADYHQSGPYFTDSLRMYLDSYETIYLTADSTVMLHKMK